MVFGANADRDGLVEVHCFLSAQYLVTVHHDDCPGFGDLRKQAAQGRLPAAGAALALYRVVDALADSFFPELAGWTTASTSSRTACSGSRTTPSCRRSSS